MNTNIIIEVNNGVATVNPDTIPPGFTVTINDRGDKNPYPTSTAHDHEGPDMTVATAFAMLHHVRQTCADVAVKCVTVDDVLGLNNLPDTPANRERVRQSWAFRGGWENLTDEDWELLYMDGAPDPEEKEEA